MSKPEAPLQPPNLDQDGKKMIIGYKKVRFWIWQAPNET